MERRSSIILEIADNGIIKHIKDSDVNGSGTDFEVTTLYEFNDSKEKIIEFLNSLIDDLNLDVGSATDKKVVTVDYRNGSDYAYTEEDLDNQIEKTEQHLINLKKLKENLD